MEKALKFLQRESIILSRKMSSKRPLSPNGIESAASTSSVAGTTTETTTETTTDTTTDTTTNDKVSLPQVKRKRNNRRRPPKANYDPTSPLGLLTKFEIPKLLLEQKLDIEDIINPVRDIINSKPLMEVYNQREIQNVEVLSITSKGDGLCIIPNPVDKNKKQIALLPFSLPGDIVTLKVFRTNKEYVEADLIGIEQNSILRNEKSECKYFGICSGCQYQSIKYDEQLKLKKDVIRNAFSFFLTKETYGNENINEKILDTQCSPLKYEYRTKLTPHYDLSSKVSEDIVPNIGFGRRGNGEWIGIKKDELKTYPGDVLDIEDCVIGTPIVRKGLNNERIRVTKEWKEGKRSKKGVTLLLREHSIKQDEDSSIHGEIFGSSDNDGKISTVRTEIDGTKIIKTCVTDNNSIISDYVFTGEKLVRFDFIANEFFQNNNSILPLVIQYVQENLKMNDSNNENYLVDAYCGSGLFSVAIASSDKNIIKKVLGVEISQKAVEFAKKNAKLNNLSEEKCDFIHGKAEKLFESIDFPKGKTSVILDPPRKGCDEVFLNQLSEFQPKTIVYISCNVHSQARDIEFFLRKTSNGSKYHVQSIKGFDFFPQTHHVESVAVLVRD